MSLVISHLKILSDKARLKAYQAAIWETLHKGDVVVDLGTGTGVLAFLALQAGARKVYAIEAGPIIDVAKKTAKENGFYDSIEFIQQDTKKVELPEPVDLIVTETIGMLGIDEGIVDILCDARKRFLGENGRMIPSSLALMAVPVFLEKGHPFRFLDHSFHGIRTTSLKQHAVNNVYGINMDTQDQPQCLSRPGRIFTTDFYSCGPIDFPLHMDGSFKVLKQGRLNGMMVFPEIQLTKKVILSLWNDGRFLPTHWDFSFLPISEEVMVSNGDVISFRLTFTEKDGHVWQVGIKGKKQKKVFTQLSAFGLPSLRHLI